MKKVAVVLFNLGGPDSKKSIKPFLFNFFMDKNIIRLPQPFRFLIACLIAIRRSKKEAGASYAFLGDKSPLLVNTQEQAEALEQKLNETAGIEFKAFVCMRYWHPIAKDIVQQVKEWGADKIILLPLYPQFSTTTTRSSFQVWDKEADRQNLDAPSSAICCYPFNEGFIRASAENIKTIFDVAKTDGVKNPRLLFSAHGLPEDIIRDGDPYQWQCEEAAAKIAKELGLHPSDWKICYQSRVGPKKWLSPSTEDALREAAKDNKAVIIYPHAFTQEHVETLVEIEIEYRHMAHEFGVPGFYRVSTVGTHPAFIDGLVRLVHESLDKKGTSAELKTRICPPQFGRCCMEERS